MILTMPSWVPQGSRRSLTTPCDHSGAATIGGTQLSPGATRACPGRKPKGAWARLWPSCQPPGACTA